MFTDWEDGQANGLIPLDHLGKELDRLAPSVPYSSKSKVNYRASRVAGTTRVSLFSRHLASLPDEIPEDEVLGNSDTGYLFIGSKGVLTSGGYGEPPIRTRHVNGGGTSRH